MNNQQQFIDIVTGGTSIGVMFGCFFFAFLGAVVNILIKVLRRDKNSKRTPVEFKWDFFWKDNLPRFIFSTILNILVVFISLRFSKELFNSELNPIFSLITGLTFDGLVGKLTDFTKKGKNE